MKYRAAIEISGVILNLQTDEKNIFEQFLGYYSEYLVSLKNKFDYEVTFYHGYKADDELEQSADFRENAIKGIVTTYCVEHRDFRADLNGKKAHVYLADIDRSGDDGFQNFLRWLLPRPLLLQNSFLMHAAGLVFKERGYVFFGPSGAGKSTISSIVWEWGRIEGEKVELLGDDSVILRLNRGELELHSAPLGCGYSRLAPPKQVVKVEKIFQIHQDKIDQVVDLTLSEQVQAIIASAMGNSLSIENIHLQNETSLRFDLALRVAKSLRPVQKLHFTKDPNFWDYIVRKNV